MAEEGPLCAQPTVLSPAGTAAGLQSQQNICFGDSGGPLLRLGGSPQQDVQLGITSFSFPECALPGMPSVFTFIPKYRQVGCCLAGGWVLKLVEQRE